VKNNESGCGWVKMDEWVKSLLGGGRAAGRWSSTRANSSLCQRSFLEQRLCVTLSKARLTKSKKVARIMWSETL